VKSGEVENECSLLPGERGGANGGWRYDPLEPVIGNRLVSVRPTPGRVEGDEIDEIWWAGNQSGKRFLSTGDRLGVVLSQAFRLPLAGGCAQERKICRQSSAELSCPGTSGRHCRIMGLSARVARGQRRRRIGSSPSSTIRAPTCVAA
jgi:hypothetical protein